MTFRSRRPEAGELCREYDGTGRGVREVIVLAVRVIDAAAAPHRPEQLLLQLRHVE